MPTSNEGPAPNDPDPNKTLTRSTIAARAEAWRELMIQSSDLLHGYQDGGMRWARLRDVAGRFNLWASNMGVFARLHASLDYRLRDLADVKELILEQLVYMVDGLDRLITVLDGFGASSGTSARDDADYESQSKPARGLDEVDTILSSLSTSIDWLHRLANMIRRASFLRQNEKASTFPLEDALGNDLTPALKKVFDHWIKRDFPNIADQLREHLISTMLLRRRRVLYRRSRQTKLALHIAKPAPKPAKPTLSAPSAASGLKLPDKLPQEAQASSGVASTQYTATTIHPEAYRRVLSTPSRVSETRTISMTSSNTDVIPPPPRIALDQLEFVCPFCCLILPTSSARNRDLWSAHVKKDLDPYVCVFFPCAHDKDILSTSADWISHEKTHCMRWYCTSKTHAPEIFAAEEKYIEHMKGKHPGKFPDTQLPLLAQNSRRPLKKIFDSCPLCGEENAEAGKSLEDHVAHHLQYLALLSLPIYDALDQADDVASASNVKSIEEGSAADSRTTMQSEKHGMPSADFSHDDTNVSKAAFAGDGAIPDVEEEKQDDISQIWQSIHLRKIRLLNKDVVISREEMKAWLLPADHTASHQRARNVRRESSSQWIFQHQKFVAWKSGPASFLSLYGEPGCGKTVLSSAIIDHFQQDASGTHTLIYFYFNVNDRQSLRGAIRSLVSQLYYEQPQSQQHLDLLWSSCMEGRDHPSGPDLITTFSKMLQDAGEMWLILDALDECLPRSGIKDPGLLSWLGDILSRQQGLHVLVTNRPVPPILWNMTPQKNPFPMYDIGTVISLEDIIRKNPSALTEKTKRVIAVMLGHGVLHLDGTGWMQQSWSASDVVFSQVKPVSISMPYMRVELTEDVPGYSPYNSDASDDDEDGYFGNDDLFVHPFPGLVALGMILMQVYLARTFESLAQEFEMGDPEQLDSNAKFALASLAFKKHFSVMLFSEQYWHAIDRCLDPNIKYDEDGEIMDQDALRRVICDEIVGPLENDLGEGKFPTGASSFILNLDTEARKLDLANRGWPLKTQTTHKSDGRISPLPKRPKSTMFDEEKQNEINSKQMLLSKPSASDLFDDESRGKDIDQQARDDFLSWKEDVLWVYDEFLASAPGSQPTKIAVLDTGLDLEHPDFVFNQERRQRIRTLKDFTGGETPKGEDQQCVIDEKGHGTHVAGLLLDFAPDSELYIAKIAAQDLSPPEFIAKAIRHAVDVWGVDIITMSFGIPARSPEYNLVEDALEYANSKSVLLFAAASFGGSNTMSTFPARHGYVICVHSTAADGMPSRFNPPREDSNNFATIGEQVESSWPTHLCDKEVNESCIAWKSGTSFATPIAVGIATFLLQYAKENLDAGTVKLLRKPQGMRAVFKEIACEKDGYDYIGPKIHPDHLFGKDKEHVKRRISVVLESS